MRYPQLKATGFGGVRVGDEDWDSDVTVRADGTVKKRKKALAKEVYGTSHVLGPAELERVCKGDPETLIVAAGYNGVLKLAKEGAEFLRARGIAALVSPTPQAVRTYNQTTGRKAILVHVTC